MLSSKRLRDIYYDPGTGFQSTEHLYQKANDDRLNVSCRIVKEWLKTQDTYTGHKPIVRRHKFQRTFVKDLADQIQMDLVDMENQDLVEKPEQRILLDSHSR